MSKQITLSSSAFYKLIEEVIEFINKKKSILHLETTWIQSNEAMVLLGISSKVTLQKLRNEGRIRFTQPQKKVILYDKASIIAYLNAHAKDVF